MRLYISEIFKKVATASTEEEKIKILKENDSLPLRHVLQASYTDSIKFVLPDTPTPYNKREVPIGLGESNLFRETRKLYLFVEGGSPSLKQSKREQLWVQLLESLQQDEAELLETARMKQLEKKLNLSKSAVEKTFPGLIKERTINTQVTKAVAVPKPITNIMPSQPPQAPAKRGKGRPSNADRKAKQEYIDYEVKKFLEK